MQKEVYLSELASIRRAIDHGEWNALNVYYLAEKIVDLIDLIAKEREEQP